METPISRKRKRVSAPAWKIAIRNLLHSLSFQAVKDEFVPMVQNGWTVLGSAQKFLRSLQGKVRKLAPSLDCTYVQLCQAESFFIQILPGHPTPMGTFGSILSHLGHIMQAHRGGFELLDWDFHRAKYSIPPNEVPYELAKLSLTQLLVYYVCYSKPTFIISTSDSRRPCNCIVTSLPWLVGHLYGEKGLSWMLFVVLFLQFGPFPTRVFSRRELSSWLFFGFGGWLCIPGKTFFLVDKMKAAIQASPFPVPTEPPAHPMIRNTLHLLLPTVLIHIILSYHALDWITLVDASRDEKDKVDLSELVDFVAFPPSVCTTPPHSQQRENKMSDYLDTHPIVSLPAIPNKELCTWEHLFLIPRLDPLPTFGKILSRFVEIEEKDPFIQYHWMSERALSDDIDACIPLLLREANCTSLLWYYINWNEGRHRDPVAEAIPWVLGYLYGESGIHWMIFVIEHIRTTHYDATDAIIELREWFADAVCAATGMEDHCTFSVENLKRAISECIAETPVPPP